MDQERQSEAIKISRRSLLRAAAIGAGAALASIPLAPGAAAAAPRAPAQVPPADQAPFRIGLVLPESQLVPAFGPGLLDGLRLALHEVGGVSAGRPLALLVERYGVSQHRAMARARALVEERGVDVLVGAFSRHGATQLGPLAAERGTPLVVADVGANAVRPDRQRPFVLRSSLGHWRASWALGEWAARTVGGRALVLSSFYDSGYDTIYAFRSGFMSAGGQPPAVHVTHLPEQGLDLAPAISAIREARPDAVFAIYSGWRAEAFVRAFAASGLARHTRLLGSSFLADEALLPALGEAADGILSAGSWAPGLGGAGERAFADAYGALAGRPADSFAALGYDTGRLLLSALDSVGNNPDGQRLRDALASARFSGARGPVATHAQTLEAASAIYLRSVEGGTLRADYQLLAAHAMPELEVDNLKTGWTNGYLCV
jgi:branched-chain amino acid transport system substrate-binding protein